MSTYDYIDTTTAKAKLCSHNEQLSNKVDAFSIKQLFDLNK